MSRSYNLLELVEMPGQGIGGTTGKLFPTIKLPMGVTCENCVLQLDNRYYVICHLQYIL